MLFRSCLQCSGAIKRGVRDRIEMLADTPQGKHPTFRPSYIHLLPLAEIIMLALGVKNNNAQSVQSAWKDFVERFETEIKCLVDAKEDELMEVDKEIGKKIIAFRKGLVLYIPGGGGKFGQPIIFENEQDYLENRDKFETLNEDKIKGQKTLRQFFG